VTVRTDFSESQTHGSAPSRGSGKPDDDAKFKADLLDLIPFLRAFARSLCGNQETADDLAQETLVKAWQARDMFAPGTNLKAWLFTILRNQFYSDRRRAWRQAPWDQEAAERIPGSAGEQSWAAELSDTARALSCLSDEQREALVGTVKSRVARARKSLISILEGEDTLPPAVQPVEGDAANDIMAQLDRLAPPEAAQAARKRFRSA
jgi:RNA polymerase sigma-70 factor (ECF subfamily)